MVKLERVNARTFRKVADMKLSAEQSKFVAPNVVSLAQVWLYYNDALPLAVCDGEEVVGFLMLDVDEDERTIGVWRFMTATEHQHKGYGRGALEAAVQMARQGGKFDLMHLDYVSGNEHARRLYKSIGFCENGEVEDGEIVMTMRLTDEPKIGMLIADEDDFEQIQSQLAREKAAGRALSSVFCDWDALKEAISSGAVTRLTRYGETIALVCGGELRLLQAGEAYRDAVQAKWREAGV